MPQEINVSLTIEQAQHIADSEANMRETAIKVVNISQSIITKLQTAFQEQQKTTIEDASLDPDPDDTE